MRDPEKTLIGKLAMVAPSYINVPTLYPESPCLILRGEDECGTVWETIISLTEEENNIYQKHFTADYAVDTDSVVSRPKT